MKTNQVYTVGQVNRYIKQLFYRDVVLKRILVRGEITNYTRAGSGHLYFSLKDETGIIACVMFAGSQTKGLCFAPKNGDKIIVTGAVSVYERDGRYQLYADKIELEGEGELYRMYLERKQRLEEMGMFAQEYKRPLPSFPKTIGIATSASGEVIHDIRNVAYRRNPYLRLVLCPCNVQGQGAAKTMTDSLRALEAYGVDLIIIGRGGGSFEELWEYNDEALAHAIFACGVPVVTAIGHTKNRPIADYVSDLSAPTPSAAAELCVPDVRALLEQMDAYADYMRRGVGQRLEMARMTAQQLMRQLQMQHPRHQLLVRRQTADELTERLNRCIEQILKDRKHTLALLSAGLDGLSPIKKLSGGYAYLSSGGRPVKSVHDLSPGDEIAGSLTDGKMTAVVRTVCAAKHPGAAADI